MLPDTYIKGLIEYAVANGLLEDADRIYGANQLLALLHQNSLDDAAVPASLPLHELLEKLCDCAVERGLIEDSVTYRDLFESRPHHSL